MYRYKLTIQYDGTEYHGWQVQKNHTTIQDEIEKSLNVFLSKKVPLVGAGRTDSGVHALGQVAHFDLDQKKEPRVIVDALNARLKSDIQIKENSNQVGKVKKVLIENKMKNQNSYFGRLENFTPGIRRFVRIGGGSRTSRDVSLTFLCICESSMVNMVWCSG